MKKSKHILMILLLLSIFNISKVNALKGYTEGFAEKIGPIKSGACYGCSWGYGVNWKTAQYNGSSKAVFCSKLRLTGVASRECVLEKGDKQWDRATQAGVADIIMNYYRYYKNDSNYMKINYYTTYAINFFLYRKDKDSNHLPDPSTQKYNDKQNSFLGTEKILSDAEKAYKKVNDKFAITLDKSKITYTKINNDYYSDWITVRETYLDASKVTKATVTIGGNSYTCNNSSTKCTIIQNSTNKNKYRIKILSNAFSSVTEGSKVKVSTSVTFKGIKTYYVAAEYDCTNYALGYQKMVPNEVIKVTETSEKTLEGSFEYAKVITDPQLSCQKELQTIKSKKLTDNTNYRIGLYNLYNKYKNEHSKYYSQLLDVNNPSCTSIENTIDQSCGNTTVVKKWISSSLSDNYLYCTASYTLNSSFFLTSLSQPNNLLYESLDGNVANANVSISCNAVKKTSANLNMNFDLQLPKITLSAFDDNYKTDNVIFESAFINNSSNCKLAENSSRVYECSSTTDEKSQLSISINGIVAYKYPEDNNLGIQKGKLNNNSVVTNADAECKKNCLKLGYGIYVPSNIYVDGDSTISLDLSGTPFNVRNLEVQDGTNAFVYKQECPYQINNIKEKNEVLYRNISTTSPFLSLTGSERYTGTNWCNFKINEKDIIPEGAEVEKVTPSCFYPGDVNKNGIWDDGDYVLIEDVVGTNVQYNYLYDANVDKVINSNDLVTVDNFMENSDYPKYDVNLDGVFDNNDISLLSRYLLGYDRMTGFQIKQGDSDNDCEISLLDIALLEKELNKEEEGSNTINSTTVDDSPKVVVQNTTDVPVDSQDTSWISFGNNYDPEFSCNANNAVVRKYIKNRPNANGDIKIGSNGTTETKKIKPLYSFTLTPDNIKEIREYNATTTYDDFNLTCTNGKECISDFVSDIFFYNSYATFNKDDSLCGSDKFCNISEIIDSEVGK